MWVSVCVVAKVRVEVDRRIATAYFVVTWGWAVCWGVVGEKVSRGLREQMVERALGMDMAYFEVDCPDVSTTVRYQ